MVQAFPLRFTLAAFVALAVFGCSCDDGPTVGQADPLPKLSTSSVIFGGAMCAETSASQTITVTNESRAQLHGSFRIEGRDAEAFRVSEEEITVGSLESVEVEVFFEPKTPGAGRDERLEAELIFESNSEERPVLDVTLDGTVSQLPVTPSFAAEWEVCEGQKVACEGTVRSACCWVTQQVNIGRVSVGRTGSATLQIQNASCGELRVERAEVTVNDDCGEGALVFPDFEEQPLVVAGNATAEVEFTFEPSVRCNLVREVTLYSNDEDQPTHTLMVLAEGAEGVLSFNPSTLVYNDVPQGQKKEMSTRGRRSGNDPLRIVEIGIAGEDRDHYSLTMVAQCGNQRDLGDDPRLLELGDDPLALDGEGCNRELDISVEYEPQSPGLHNDAQLYVTYLDAMDEEWEDQVTLHGRSAPRLVYVPDVIAFDTPFGTGCGGENAFVCGSCVNETALSCANDGGCPDGDVCLDGICTKSDEAVCATSCGEASRSFRLCNEGVNDLVLSKLEIVSEDGTPGGPVDLDRDSDTYGEPIFTFDAGSCGGATLEPGACCEGTVHLVDNRTSGRGIALLMVHSNDPAWAGEGTPIDIDKSTLTVTAPSARFDVETSRPTVNEWFTLDARASHAEMGSIEKYEWSLTDVIPTSTLPTGFIDPSDVNAGCGRPDGECFRLLNADEEPCQADGSDCVILQVKPDRAVSHSFELLVHGSVCGPRLQGRWTADVPVRSPE